MAQVIEHIVSQHAEEAAFLWLLRDRATRAPHYNLRDLAELDNRIEAHIDGLHISEKYGYDLCMHELQEHRQSGEAFVATVLTLEAGEHDNLMRIIEIAESNPESERGLRSAFGWVSSRYLKGIVKEFLNADSAFLRKLGIVACALHRTDPGPRLAVAVQDADTNLRARSLRAAGELGRVDLAKELFTTLDDENEQCRFWAAWSAVLLGDRRSAQDYLQQSIMDDSGNSRIAIEVLYRSLPPDRARRNLRGLIESGKPRHAITGAGANGNPRYFDWLLSQMKTPELARIAGESISQITGVDLAYDDLDGDEPEEFQAGPTESPDDDDVDLDDDEDLPWPIETAIAEFLERSEANYRVDNRYLCGLSATENNAGITLAAGMQRQRIAAAIELALARPEAMLFEYRAPAHRQIRQLESN